MSTDRKPDAVVDDVDEKTVVDDETKDALLPQPASAPAAAPAKPRFKYSAAAIIPVWIVLSSAVIIYNNYLYNQLYFKFPVFLVTWHLVFAVRTPSSHIVSS